VKLQTGRILEFDTGLNPPPVMSVIETFAMNGLKIGETVKAAVPMFEVTMPCC
jgi:hypothetical protein